MTEARYIETDQGKVAVKESRNDGPALLLIHGNSSCKEAFARQFESPALAQFRLIALDLPGHGASDDARRPETAYSFTGYARVAAQVLDALNAANPSVFGWSLGGHIGLEMIGLRMPVARLMICGTPPVAPQPESLMAAFNSDFDPAKLTGKRDFDESDVLAYAAAIASVDGTVDPAFVAMCRRTDGRAREMMMASAIRGEPLDEREIVATTTIPLAIVNGADDPFIRPEYFETLKFHSLWSKGIVRLDGAGHAPFLEAPERFNMLLAEFASN